jgi:gamma-glutamyltranspeptidase/glutathione hydrolase
MSTLRHATTLALTLAVYTLNAQTERSKQTMRPVVRGSQYAVASMKPEATQVGERILRAGGNAFDAAVAAQAVLALVDAPSNGVGSDAVLLLYDARKNKVVSLNAEGTAPKLATIDWYKKNLKGTLPDSDTLLAGTVPGVVDSWYILLDRFGTKTFAEVLAPVIELAEKGFPLSERLASAIDGSKKLRKYPSSVKVYYPEGKAWKGGDIFRNPQLAATLTKMVDAERENSAKGRREALRAARDRFYKGDIAEEFCRGSREQGGLHTTADLANWEVKIEEPVKTTYKGVEVYKLTCWTQGPVLLQALNILESFDLQSMGYNSARYLHALYQAMNLAYADRDFYYGDIYFPPEEPLRALLSKEYAKQRVKLIDWKNNNPEIRPGDPYSFEGKQNPFAELLKNWSNAPQKAETKTEAQRAQFEADFRAGTTSIQAADEKGWVISVTPSGGWLPACVAGNTGIGMSQRMQSFVLDEAENPFNVVAPGKRPRVTLTPTLAFKDEKPFLSFSVQGGDTQDQNLLQFFLNVVEFGMNVQEACEAANITSYQMRSSFGEHKAEPGRVTLNQEVPSWVRRELQRMGYKLDFARKTSGPITAIFIDQEHGTLWGGASNHGEDYGIAW